MIERIWCPRCRQGWVQHYRLGGSTERWVCEECEGTWLGRAIGPIPDGDLGTELVDLGRPPLWDSIEPIDLPESDSRSIN